MDGGSIHLQARRLTAAGAELRDEVVAEEVAVALVYNGISHAVMMATPCDLEDFARGFTLTEHLVESPSEIYDIEVEDRRAQFGGRGIEVQLRIANQRMAALQERRRSLAGRTGCGLCGAQTLEAAVRHPPPVAEPDPIDEKALQRALI